MADERVPQRSRTPHARFRCPRCERFVTAGTGGICPTCGFVPPVLLPRPIERASASPTLPWRWLVPALVLAAVAARLTC